MAYIGVVIPVYNVEQYLDRCVSSVLAQTFTDFRIVLVEDGSPDNSGALCDFWAAKDTRIHVIHQKNQGLSAARNAGIDYLLANSDIRFITFIDSDDWIHERMLQVLLSAAQEHKVNISVCGYEETQGVSPCLKPEQLVGIRYSAEDFYRNYFINATIACGKLYSRDCFETARYPVGKIHEDEFLTYRLLFTQGELAYVPAPLYAYYVNMNGITRKKWNPRRLDVWEAYEQQIAFFEERRNIDMVRFRYRGYLENALVNMNHAEQANTSGEYDAVLRFMRRRIRSVIRRAWKVNEISFWPDFDMLYRFSPLLTRIYRLYLEIKSK